MIQLFHADIYPKNTKTVIQKDIPICMFIAALFTTAKIWKQSKCLSVDEWIKKMWYIYYILLTLECRFLSHHRKYSETRQGGQENKARINLSDSTLLR